jgi:hypothetical protein
MTEPLIRFYETDHSYWHGENKLLSVSGLWSHYKPPFERKHYALCKAFENLDPIRAKEVFVTYGKSNPLCVQILSEEFEQDVLTEEYNEVLMGWDEYSAERSLRGTLYHLKRETESYNQGYEINPYTGSKLPVKRYKKIYDNQSLAENLYELPDGCYPELLIHNLEYGLVGQEDKIFLETVDGIRFCYSDDYKTDKEIKGAYYDRRTRRFQMFKKPLSFMKASTENYYALKISTYSWMMEQHGFAIGGQRFTHIPDIETEKEYIYEVPYMKWEVEKVLNYHFA